MAERDELLHRKRSTSTLANTISFTHTRGSTNNDQNELKSPTVTTNTSSKSNNTSPFNIYMNKNGSSSTLHSITQTLSNVGFTSVLPNSANSDSTQSLTSQTLAKKENALTRAKMFAKTKTKELQKRTKNDLEKSYHHQHHNFLKKTGHTGLSSSSSTSKVLDSRSTLYSFDPSAPINDKEISRQTLRDTSLKNLSLEEKDGIADELWSTIFKTVQPLFKIEKQKDLKLKRPVEDLNKMIEIFMRLRIENNVTATALISEIQELLKTGFNILENEISIQEDIQKGVFYRITITWDHFFGEIYHYLLAILVPLELEFQGTGTILKNVAYWQDSVDIPSIKLSTKKLLLVSFRDYVVLPHFETDIIIPDDLEPAEFEALSQCFGMLKSIQSNSYSQRIIDHIFTLLFRSSVR
ncbi:hypothetical protein WICMUC_000902 [Wickerhamomyces mucosus]|uniref:Target of rapamycin complex 2 subunit BIT2 n=1 Tax=Wickerhamomyces mucosus TaxID=1378264 RepID=A0A9P8PYF0_9ASCO|nr:hypothetical protein WICMUC_000902 [Wickerhamomyces mucosus]